MITFYNDQHRCHQGKKDMFRGEFVPCFEVASRVDHVVSELRSRHFDERRKELDWSIRLC